MCFLPFKWKTQAYSPQISITHNKNRGLLLHLLINWIFSRSPPQMLSLKEECTSDFSNVLIIDLCNSSANC